MGSRAIYPCVCFTTDHSILQVHRVRPLRIHREVWVEKSSRCVRGLGVYLLVGWSSKGSCGLIVLIVKFPCGCSADL